MLFLDITVVLFTVGAKASQPGPVSFPFLPGLPVLLLPIW